MGNQVDTRIVFMMVITVASGIDNDLLIVNRPAWVRLES